MIYFNYNQMVILQWCSPVQQFCLNSLTLNRMEPMNSPPNLRIFNDDSALRFE